MSNWICSMCSSTNAEGQRYCGACGQQRETSQSSPADLPPTIMGGYVQPNAAPSAKPGLTPNPPNFQQPNFQQSNQQQPNYQQPNNQQQNYQQQPSNSHQSGQFQQQPHQSQAPPFQSQSFSQTGYSQPAPKKSNLKLFAAIGGIIGFIFLGIIGIVVWKSVVSPYLAEQAFIKKEKENQTNANSTSPDSILPSTLSGYNRTQTFNKLQLLQASQYLTPELKQGAENVTDAAAAEYVNTANGSLKVVTQIFKFNTPENAAAKCRQIAQEMEKRKDSSTKVDNYSYTDSKRPNECAATATGKNDQSIKVNSLYGFLIVSSGGKSGDVWSNSNAAIAPLRR